MKWQLRFCLVVLTGVLVTGCSKPAMQHGQANDPPSQPFETTGLAGEWDVSDGTIEKSIVLDCFGIGAYGWQGGTVITTVVRGNYWAGTWHQPGNDREGGFEVRLSEDRASAEGRWWYSRIGEKHFAPGEKGDTFSMSRPMRTTQTQDKCRPNKGIHEARAWS